MNAARPILYPPVPLPVPILQKFGANPQRARKVGMKGHNGIDLGVPEGTIVKAAHDGIVQFAGDGSKHCDMGASAGLCILLRSTLSETTRAGLSFMTGYAHLSSIHAKEGTTIKAGDIIGLSGSTGWTTGPHLHFELLPVLEEWHNGYLGRVDPLPALEMGVALQKKGAPLENRPPSINKGAPLG